MIKVKGKLVYDPVRPDFRKLHKQHTLIVELPRDQMDLYYQWFLRQKYGQCMAMQRPMYGLHCTVVRGDEKIDKAHIQHWKKYQGQSIEIEYDPTEIERHWAFWSITVKSQRLIEIREELGLHVFHRFHITIGRQYDWQPK